MTRRSSVCSAAHREPSEREERANAYTHGLACLAAVAGAVVLMRAVVRGGGPWQVWACGFYAATMVATYAASTASHVVRSPNRRARWRRADQALIFLYIAGSFSPIALTWLRASGWWWLIGWVWAVAAVGFISKVVFAHNVRAGSVTTWLYVLLGWLPVVATWWIWRAMPSGLFAAMYLGGGFYTLGLVFFYYDRRVRFGHAAWHVAVIAGSVCHYWGILHYCTTEPTMLAVG